MGTLVLAVTIVVSAAASLTDVLTAIAARFETATGHRVQVNAGPSNTLARQIVEGAPVDVFISADDLQMDVVERAGRLVAGSRAPLLSNRLVVVAPATSTLRLSQARDLAAQHVKRIAMANPNGVPAGVYARSWLQTAGVWQDVSSKAVPLPSVRAALAAVREGRVDAGIVYATDARAEPAVKVIFEVPAAEAPLVTYPLAIIASPRQAEARQFALFLRGRAALDVFEAAGFTLVASH